MGRGKGLASVHLRDQCTKTVEVAAATERVSGAHVTDNVKTHNNVTESTVTN